MPSRKYVFERGGVERLELTWKGLFKEMSIALDGRQIGTIADQRELAAGKEFSLPDGSKLKVQLLVSIRNINGHRLGELMIVLNGRKVQGHISSIGFFYWDGELFLLF